MVLVLIILVAVSSSGCWDQKIYEESGFVMQVGYETSNSGDIMMSFTIPVLDSTSKERTELVYSNANLLREFREKVRNTLAKVVEGGKIEQILISDTLARKGIHDFFEVIERDPTDPPDAYVIIAEGSPRQIFDSLQKINDKPAPAIYIYNLIRSNIKSAYVPETRMFQFSTQYFAPGIDPMAPIVKLQYDKGKGVEVTGSALFAGDKMVGKIDVKQTSLLLAMMGKMKRGVYVSKILPENETQNNKKGCAITITKAKRKISIDINQDKPVVDISLNLRATIDEFKWNNKYNEKFQKFIEDTIAADIKEKCEQVLKYTQEVGSDPLGIGDIIRAKHNNYWQKVNWENSYRNIAFNVKVNINISNHGIIK